LIACFRYCFPYIPKKNKTLLRALLIYYSPKAQKELHKKKPKIYDEVPFWAASDEFEEVTIPGLASGDDFTFYKYSEERAQFYEKLSKKKTHSKKK
jgi:hypothetical protein